MKQSAVEFLHEEIKDMIPNDTIIRGKYKQLVKQAKEMEEKEIKDAWNNGVLAKTFDKKFEYYYNEKYNK